jgi:hypothetical protein
MRAAVKLAASYLRAGRLYLHPESRTIKGFWITSEPILVTSEDELIKAAGARSYEAFADSAKRVGILLDNNEVVFTPTSNGGPGRGFLNLKTKIRCQPIEAEVAVGPLAAFEACE